MAKAIKIIKCPSCGSVEKSTVKEDHYQCANCGADYFLDNDDVNINVNYKLDDQYSNSGTERNSIENGSKRVLYVICGVVIAALAIYMFASKKTAQRPPATYATVSPIATPIVKPIEDNTPKFEEKFRSPLTTGCFIYPQEEGLMLYRLDEYTKKSVGMARSNDQEINRYQITKYDLSQKTRTALGVLGDVPSYNVAKWDSYPYENGERYFFKDKKEVWRFDPRTERLENVTQTLLEDFPQYASGIAEVSFRHNARAGYNSIYVMTNNGKSLHYFPDLKEAYEDTYAFQMLKEGPKRDPATLTRVGSDVVQTGFAFANSYEKNNKLIKYQYKTADGLPRRADFQSAREDQTGKKNYALGQIYPINSKWTLLSDKNISEGAFYHEPAVVYYDEDVLLIAAKRSVASDAQRFLQSIDPDSGELLWSTTIRSGQYSPLAVNVMQNGDEFLISYDKNRCEGAFTINNKGEVIDKFDLDSFQTIEK